MNYLYGHNTFRFTRLVGQLGPEDWSIFVGFNPMGSDAFSEFLGVKHKSVPNHPTRVQLIRKLLLEDTDFGGSKSLASSDFQGHEQLFLEHLNDQLAWQFYMLNRLENIISISRQMFEK